MTTAKRKESRAARFNLDAPSAKEVTLAGDFNNWDSTSTRLRQGKDNMWRRELRLKGGRYEYKFVVDGNWILDPNNTNRAWNSFGTENSVIEL